MYLRRKRAATPPCRELVTGEKEPNRDDEHYGEVPVHRIRRPPPREEPGNPGRRFFPPLANRGSVPMTPYTPGSTTMPLPLTSNTISTRRENCDIYTLFVQSIQQQILKEEQALNQLNRLNVEENMGCQPKSQLHSSQAHNSLLKRRRTMMSPQKFLPDI